MKQTEFLEYIVFMIIFTVALLLVIQIDRAIVIYFNWNLNMDVIVLFAAAKVFSICFLMMKEIGENREGE